MNTKHPVLQILAGLILAPIVIGAFSSDKHEKKTGETETRTPAQSKASKAKKPRGSGNCLDASQGLPDQIFRVLKRIDKTHYKLRNEANHKDQSYVVLETKRELVVGESTQFREVTDLGMTGDWSKLVIHWREGCSAQGKAAADYTQGIWWTPINPDDPNGAKCVNSVSKSYNVSPVNLMKTSNGGCVVSDGSSPFSTLFLDCTSTALAMKLTYMRTRAECLKFVTLVASTHQTREEVSDE